MPSRIRLPSARGPRGGRGGLGAYLRAWAFAVDVPLVLLLDETDVVSGAALVSRQRQRRDGFMDRGVGRFPTCVALIGMRDLRDHVTQAKDGRAVNPEERLDFPALLAAFRQWWGENADVVAGQIPEYPQAVPHLALCAFLQRVVNGGGEVHREFAAGRGAMDVLVTYGPDRFALELKRVRTGDALETVVERGVTQLGKYLGTAGLEHGWLVVFDVRPDRSWEERLWAREETTRDGKRVVVLGA